MKKRSVIFILVLILACNIKSFSQSKDLLRLASWMEGSYSSQAQSLKDTSYFDIRLQIIRIWKNRADGYWFYIEQAVAKYIDKPYRQRVYHLSEREKDVFESAVFTMKDPLRFTHHPDLVEQMATDSLTLRDGCSVILKKKGKKRFKGSTDGNKCPSDRSGASYATSVVTIRKDGLHSWDQGFNEKGVQVWGAVKGGYDFHKIK